MADRLWFGRGRSAHTAQQQAQQKKVSTDTQREAGKQAFHASLVRSLTQVPVQQDHHHHHHKPPTLAKISSYMGLSSLTKVQSPTVAKAQPPTVAMYPELIMERSESIKPGAAGYHITSVDGGGPIGDWRPALKQEGASSFHNDEDLTWHNPSLRQMVETVSCTMMKNGSCAPIPRHLNGWIAGIMEEVSHQTGELESLRSQIAELKITREQEVIEFTKVTEEWAQREKNFKAEINRLEHIISDTQQGAESVILARAGSVVNRNDGRAFRAKLNRLSRSEEGDGSALEESHSAEKHRGCLVQQDKRDRVAVSPGDGLNVDTTPFQVLGSTPGENNDIHLSKQLRDANPKRGRKQDQEISANLVAAPARIPKNSNDSSSQSSSGNASCSSSLITQGLAKLAQAKVTPHTSPTKDEKLCGRPVEELKRGGDALGTIRQFATQNGGLPDDAIDDESSCSSSAADPRSHRTFSFSRGDDIIVPEDGATSIAKTSTNVGNVGSSSRRPLQLSAAQEQSLDSQIDGASRFSNGVPSNASMRQNSNSPSSSSDKSHRRSHASVLRSMGHNHVTEANDKKAAADELRKLEVASFCSPMIVAMARERSVPSPSRKVQEDQAPRGRRLPRLENRAFISDEELALVPNRRPGGQRARGRAADVVCNQAAAVAVTRALQRSISGQNGQDESQAQTG